MNDKTLQVALEDIVRNARLKRFNGNYSFSEEKIVGQMLLLFDRFTQEVIGDEDEPEEKTFESLVAYASRQFLREDLRQRKQHLLGGTRLSLLTGKGKA